MTKKSEEISVKIGTKEEAFWTEVLEASEKRLLQCRCSIPVEENLIALCKEKIKEEQ